LAAAVSLSAGCGDDAGTRLVAERPPVAKIAVSPAPGGNPVASRSEATAKVTEGRFDALELRNAEGRPVAGRMNPERTYWTAGEPLGFGKTYSWVGSATGTDGKKVDVRGEFTTVKPAKLVRATVNPVDGAEVGVGMPIKVEFDEPPTDRVAAQKALSVDTSVPVEGSWAWLNPHEVHWRPKEYWPEGIEVTVRAALYSVPYGNDVFGKADVSSHFKIGRAQVIKASTPSHEIQVYRGGRPVLTYPASFGDDGDLDRNTPNGTYVVMAREPVGDFSNPRYGYTNVKKKWSMRISNHGEYIHENEENAANIGRRNTSHGCVNLRENDAKALFDSALIGDPVEVTGAAATATAKSDVYDWQLSWSQWKKMSAV
jgi:lipoprotein-anchoring transpeptidase ErfK/SrfK